MIEAVFVVCVGVSIFDVSMRVVVPKDAPVRGSLDTRMITIVDSPNLGSPAMISYLEEFLDVDEQPILTADATFNGDLVWPQRKKSEVILENEPLGVRVLHPARVNLDVVVE